MASDSTSRPNTTDRPLSPHLQIYRWQWTMALSILHRMTGVALAAGMLLLLCWLAAAAAGPTQYAAIQAFLGHWIGRALMLGFVFSLFYHLLNGIRHLFWDAGKGFAIPIARASGILVALGAVVLTLLAFVAGYGLI